MVAWYLNLYGRLGDLFLQRLLTKRQLPSKLGQGFLAWTQSRCSNILFLNVGDSSSFYLRNASAFCLGKSGPTYLSKLQAFLQVFSNFCRNLQVPQECYLHSHTAPPVMSMLPHQHSAISVSIQLLILSFPSFEALFFFRP